MRARLHASLPLAAGFAATEAAAYATDSRLLLALAVVWLIALPVALARALHRPFDPFEPIWVFSIVFIFTYALVPGLELWRPSAFQSLPGFLTLSPPDYYAAAWLGGGAFFIFCLAYFWRPAQPRPRSIGYHGDRGGLPGLTATGVVLVAVGILALEANLRLANASALSPRQVFTGQLRAALLQTEQGRGYLNLGYLAFSTGLVCLAIAVSIWARDRPTRKRWVVAYFGVASGTAVVLFALVLGSRNLAIATLVGLLVAFHYRYRTIPTRVVVSALCVLALGAIAFISLRNGRHLTADPIAMAGYASKSFDGFNFLVTALARVHHLLWGRSLGGDLLYTYLPRQLFHAKPTVYGIVVAQDTVIPGLSATVGSGSYPPGILAEGYVNFGLAGLFALPAIAATLLRLSYAWVKNTASTVAVVVFGYLLGNLTGVFRGFGPVLPSLVVLLLLLVGLQLPERVIVRARVLALPAAGLLVALLVAVPAAVHAEITAPAALARNSAAPRTVAYLPRPLDRLARGPKPTMVLFWSTWCRGCAAALMETHSAATAAGLAAAYVDFQDAPTATRAAMSRGGVGSVATVRDDGSVTIGDFHVESLPAVVILRGKHVLCRLNGGLDATSIMQTAARAAQAGSC